ncbi:class I adenylate-forming enzyme family protein [Desulfothermus sp.]
MILAPKKRLEEYTQKGWWGTTTLIDYFENNAKKFPEKIAVIDPYNKEELIGSSPERITYEKFKKATDSVATVLLDMGIEKDDIIMVQIPNCWELAALYFGIAKAGAITSPVPMQWRKKELSYIASLTNAKLIITVQEFKGFKHKDLANELMKQHSSIKNVLLYNNLRDMLNVEPDYERLQKVHIDANDIFTLCWTSGTEADPKGCPLSHNNWINQALIQKDSVGLSEDTIYITAGPLVNMAAIGTTYMPWIVHGGSFVLHHPFDFELYIKQIIQEKVHYTLMVPAIANIIVKHPKSKEFDLSSLKYVTLGSAAPSLYTMQEFKKRWNIDVGNVWGQNEGTGIIAGVKDVPDIEKRVDHFPFYGRPNTKWSSDILNERIKLKLIDPTTGREVINVGDVGELAYKGPNVIPCYFKRPDITEKSFDEDGYFYTGDLFVIKDEKYIGFFERKKDIIVRGGFNISTQEVENAILAHPKVIEVAVVGYPDEVLGERGCAFIVPAPGENITLDEICKFLEEQGLAKYKFPEKLKIIDTLPRNPVGKILKRELKKQLS